MGIFGSASHLEHFENPNDLWQVSLEMGVEPQNRRLSLGIKQLQPDVWESFFASHNVGDMVHGKMLRTAQFGAFVEIAEGVEGLCHISEAGEGDEPSSKPA